ncbi:Protein RALF-like 5 [Arabidopsis thaliana]|uniref:Protein RALF-like 5 n=2 Tax=Arabidopsis TaxID=3701 RepID=RLF5_ARATH|nr:RALF-like 5 [Arabidopsis thaliana]A8MQI8.1 RecName: Full=Protein RALF-like 5; Flags: Precursor [Arabidopsis thaliana]AEE31797.1 RALF-like 5 [Arabidopsis thaliana]KAG7648533.1 Rapid ALkalinization Factor [Arabidopsis thaliana x Arabidopsis arenosa]|eukprot:NP_001077666.1 RALF-like 5 [Arabidopsis thaliana]
MLKAQVFMFVTVLVFVCVFINSNDAKRYIEYPPWQKHPCNPRFPTPDCYKRTPANPYRRGCTCISRCRRDCGGLSTWKKLLDTILKIPV